MKRRSVNAGRCVYRLMQPGSNRSGESTTVSQIDLSPRKYLMLSSGYVTTIIVECCKNCSIVVLIARYRLVPAIDTTPRSNVHRTTAVNDTTYAVVDPTGDSASGRAEETRSFCKKDEPVPCCRRRIWLPAGEWFVTHADLTEHRKPCNLLMLEKAIRASGTFHLQRFSEKTACILVNDKRNRFTRSQQ